MNKIVVLIATLLLACACLAQDGLKQYVIGEYYEIESDVLGETRSVIVSTPIGYDEGDQEYAVIYLLDGNSHFQHTNGIVTFMFMRGLMPPAIIVAVTNTKRIRDMTPMAEDMTRFPTGGGADNFLDFFESELIPFVDENFRTHPYRVLIGHSLGGLFAIHALVNRPDVFDSYISISPSLWWDEQKLVDDADKFFASQVELNKSIYLTMGDEGGSTAGGLLKLTGVLSEHEPKGFKWDWRVMEDETHGTIPYRSTRQGLYFIFGDWMLGDLEELYDSGGGVQGLLDKAQAITAKFKFEKRISGREIVTLCFQLLSSDRLDEALSVLEFDKEKYPPVVGAYLSLGEGYVEIDDDEKAKYCFTEALKLDPKNEVARTALTKLGVDPDSIVIPPPGR